MGRLRYVKLIVAGMAVLAIVLPWGSHTAYGNDPPAAGLTWYANSPSGVLPNGGNSGTPLQKFADSLAPLSTDGSVTNNLGQYIEVAVPDATLGALFPNSDCYRLAIHEFHRRVHSNLPVAGTTFRGYTDIGNGKSVTGANQYGGPLIVASRDRAVRVLFENQLPNGTAGNLMIPVDPTYMGAGEGPLGPPGGYYTQNRTSIHLHGGFSPWISDGTPHQWYTPNGASANTSYLRGDSNEQVPDMWFKNGAPVAAGTAGATHDPGPGKTTLYYPNQQSGRLQFYHDHAVAVTRLNVYAGMVAGYLIHDPVEDALIANGTIPNNGGGLYNWGIPLIIQDKTFVPQNIACQDNKWGTTVTTNWGVYGDLWWPHIYEPNQSLSDSSGINAYGRWDYGPWVQPNILAPDRAAGT